MKTLIDALWTRHGRCPRSEFCSFTLLICFIAAVFNFTILIYFIQDLQANPMAPDISDPAFQGDLGFPALLWVLHLAAGIAGVLWMVIAIRRRRDRDRSGLDVVVYRLPSLIVQGFGIDRIPYLGAAIGVGLTGYAIDLLVVLGVLKGTPGPNRYGPNPLDEAAKSAAPSISA